MESKLIVGLSIMSYIYKALDVLKKNNYNPIYIGYYGAHNYNLQDDKSDFDFKAIVIPTLKQCIKRESISTTIECDFGNIDVKDLLTFTQVINKGNFSYLEAIQTPNSWEEEINGFSVKEFFKNANLNYMSMVGAIYEKNNAFMHEYPSKKIEFEKFGCDPKQFQAAVRLYDLLQRKFTYKTLSDNQAFYFYEKEDTVDLTKFNQITFPSTRYYIFSRDEFISMKRKLIMDIAEIQWIFDKISLDAKNLLPKNYKFIPNNYTDQILDVLVDYYRKN